MFDIIVFHQVVYILDQVRALENEMLLRIKQQGLDITPKIVIVSSNTEDKTHDIFVTLSMFLLMSFW